MSCTCGISGTTLTKPSPSYLAWNSSLTSLARITLLSGMLTVLMIPWNHGATCGMNATSSCPPTGAPAGRSVERWCPASRSWMWSVRAYGLTAWRRSSGVTLGWEPDLVPAPE